MKKFRLTNSISVKEAILPEWKEYYFKRSLNVTCCVCGKWDNNSNYLETDTVFGDEVFVMGDTYFIIPAKHQHAQCKELFLMNPMAYEND